MNETVRYNVKLTHIDLDCSCLLLHKLLHPFIIANGYPVDSMTRKEAVELGHIEVEIKVLLEYLFELSSKSRTFYKWCNDEDIVADGGPGASTMTCKHSAKRGESGNCKTYRFEGVTLLTGSVVTRNLMSLTLVVAEVQSGSSTLHGFEVTPIVA